ncbi:MAG: 30S ribosomal protein S1 [bacterium]
MNLISKIENDFSEDRIGDSSMSINQSKNFEQGKDRKTNSVIFEDDFPLDQDSMSKLYFDTFKKFEEGEVIKGTILQLGENEVVIDIGYKSEGTIPLSEFFQDGKVEKLNIGDVIDVFLEKMEDSNGTIVLSKDKADKIKIWTDLEKAYEDKEPVEGRVIKKVKGGLIIDIGVQGFLPGSQIDLKPIKNLDSLVGQKIKLRVIKISKKKANIVFSRRVILEEDRENQRKDMLENIKDGDIARGVIKNITEYGAFVDLGGIDGLLHVTDMSWGRVRHPSELFVVGDKIEAVILKFDREKERVSLGYKQKTMDPWQNANIKYPENSRIRGKVVSIADYGAFIELEEGIEGLIHVSEMSWTKKIKHPSKIISVGETVEAVVLNLDPKNRRISLGLKQIEPNPWLAISEKYLVGSKITGKVRNITDFGIFVELEEGIDGLIHISDLSWTQKVNHPSEVIKKGEKIEALVLNIDIANEKIALGLKQLTTDPWQTISEKYQVGNDAKVKIIKITNFGAFAEIEKDIEGLIHLSELSVKRVSHPSDVVKIDDEIDVKIMKVDSENRKIALSIRAYNEGFDKKEIEAYLANQTEEKLGTIGLEQEKKTVESND